MSLANSTEPAKPEFQEALATWVSCLLATYAKTGVAPSSYITRPHSSLGQAPGRARALAVRLWLDVAGDTRVNEGWVEVVFRLAERTQERLMTEARVSTGELRSRRFLGHCRAIIDLVKPQLTSDLLHAAIAAGWTGCDTRGATPFRKAHHLLRLVREWLPGEAQPPAGQP